MILLLSSFASYFMDSYNIVIDDDMIHNIISTDLAESLDLYCLKLVLYVVFLGIIPSFFIYKSKIIFKSGWQELFSRSKFFSLILISIFTLVLIFSDFYSSFFREHKPLRYYANPSYYIFSTGKYISSLFKSNTLPFQSIGLQASTSTLDKDRELIIFVVGETARADRFSLNGYTRETNPLLKKEAVVSFSNFWSCGTSTAKSVPCMFSNCNSSDYNKEIIHTTENALDILQHAGVNVLWLDNNSDSKGVADRIPYQSYKSPETNPVCDDECRDVGMLKNLQNHIDKHPKEDIFIVLHQMGNHGPAYYKRYPAEFEKFTPVCKTNQLEECSIEEINNAYDNAILYTDFFLSKVIELLKNNQDDFEAAMFYVSDHGESLGEAGLYLHGLPNFVAPDTQRHVPAILWTSENFDEIDMNKLYKNRNAKYSHDNIFHTILSFVEIETPEFDKSMDIIKD
jgi:lipid A ethanolaminephosphotransferase